MSERGPSEGWKLLRNIAGLALVPLFVAPGFLFVAAVLLTLQQFGLERWWLAAAVIVSSAVAVVGFVLLIPIFLATDAWLTRVFGIGISERRPDVLSPAAVKRLTFLPRQMRPVLNIVAASLLLIVPLLLVHFGAVWAGLSGDLRGRGWLAISVLAVALIAYFWVEPKLSRLIDRWIGKWDEARKRDISLYGARPFWCHVAAALAYLILTLGIPFAALVFLAVVGASMTLIHAVVWSMLAISALAAIYAVDVGAMWLRAWFGKSAVRS